MLIDFTVPRRTGVVSSLDADRFDLDVDGGANPDEGGGDGSQPINADAELDATEGANADARQAAGDGAGEDDDDDDDDVDARYEGLPADEQIKRLRAGLKKAKRKLAKRTPVYQQVQEMVAQGLSLDDLKLTHRQYRLLSEQIATNPRLRALVNGGEDATESRPARRDAGRPAVDAEFTFDDSAEALGFDPKDSLVNRNLAASMRDTAFLKHQVTKLLARLDPDAIERRVGGLERQTVTTRRQAIEREWTEATNAAVLHITDPNKKREEGLRVLFKDQMRSAMEKTGGTRAAKDIVAHYFAKLGIDPRATARATSAAARTTQQGAARVQQLQRQPGQSGQPAPAKPAKRELLSDVGKRLRSVGGQQVR